MSQNKKLSACLIVNNEERHIAHCLASIQQFVDEIIVVDTGSTDKTKQVAAAYHAKIYDYSWTNNFAEARNFSIEQASGDWILYIDADERLEASNGAILRTVIQEEKARLFGFKVVNYYGELPVSYEKAHVLAQNRLFKKQGAQFTGAIHEQLSFSPQLETEEHRLLPLSIFHYGYLTERIEEKDKLNRNLAILINEKVKDSNNPWIDYHIANVLYQLNEKVKAYEFVNLAITGFIALQKLPPSLLYKLKYSIVLDTQLPEGVDRSIEMAIKIHPDYPDLYYMKGLILKQLGRDAEAITAFDEAIALGETHLQHFIQVGAGSFLAAYEKGGCLERTGQQTAAMVIYEQIAQTQPSFLPAQEGYQRIKAMYQN